ncbi:MAG: sulfatase-like hydrolase/transferase [Candidatus Limnocylindrales bacterium]
MRSIASATRLQTSTRIALVATLLALATLAPGTSASAEAVTVWPESPDIIVVYIDDVPPLDGRLWTRRRTPYIRRHIIDRGVEFRNAVGESPLCCPGRANLLSGLHTHNNGVTRNDAALLDPRVSIASELRGAGYHTVWLGKYLNFFASLRGYRRLRHEAPWDVFRPYSGRNHGYLYRPVGAKWSLRPKVHQMRLLQQHTRSTLRNAPRHEPLFAILSTYSGHIPNTPLAEFRGSSRCSGIGRWKPSNYGRASARGKPAYVRRLAARRAWAVPRAGYPLTRLCEDMLGVDQLVGIVVEEQRARGRLANTVLVLTSDNGMAYGEHGIITKQVPYAVRVPLFVAWPAGLGTRRRVSRFPTSNIDLAPTFCEIAGCVMGPYRSGQTRADGVSLVPALQGRPPRRDALLTVMLSRGRPPGRPVWTSVTTYASSPLGRWRFVRYRNGERELYDLRRDPGERVNLAGQRRHADIQRRLDRRLARLLREGRP